MSKVLEFIDTHCHIHDSEFVAKYSESTTKIIKDAEKAGVKGFVCVGTDVRSSIEAMSFARGKERCYASVALHPHEAATISEKDSNIAMNIFSELLRENDGSIVAVGECGLDYFYHQSAAVKQRQKQLLRQHLDLAQSYNLPLIFHIRNQKEANGDAIGDAFTDFFAILDKYQSVKGVVHSFSAGVPEMQASIKRGLYIGLNGIMTFSKQKDQLQAAKMVPLENLVLETDAPFLTPAPFRGKMCKPEHVVTTAAFLAELRAQPLEVLAKATTDNARRLFGIN